MSLTYEQAVDDMSTMFKTAWDTTGHIVHWEDVKTQRDVSDNPYARFVIRHSSPTRGPTLGGVGNRLFSRSGVIIVSIFVPIGNGLSTSLALAKLVGDVYEGNHSPNGIWFRDVSIPEIGRDGEFHQRNVIINFEYDEIK